MRLGLAEQRLQAQQDRQENENARLVRDLLNVGQAQPPAVARPAAVNGGPLYGHPAPLQQQYLQQPQGNAYAYDPFFVDPIAWPGAGIPAVPAVAGLFGAEQQMPQNAPQPMARPAAPLNNAQQQQQQPQQGRFQLGPIPNGFAVPYVNDDPPMPNYLQIARDNAILPAAAPLFDLRDDAPIAQDPPHLANVARNMHQLELMRQQHDAREVEAVEARLARFRELAERMRRQQ